MRIILSNKQCTIIFESKNKKALGNDLDCFALILLEQNIQTLILKFEYNYDESNLDLELLFSCILENSFIKCLSIQGPINLNWDTLTCLKNKEIDLELKYGINTNIRSIIKLAKSFKSITCFELGTVASSDSEQDFLELLQLLSAKHGKLSSLILPLPKKYSSELIMALNKFLITTKINKFGFSSPCFPDDLFTLLSHQSSICNLGLAGVKELTEESCRKIFTLIKGNLRLTHLTIHNWDESISTTIFNELSQLPYLESVMLNCGTDVKFITNLIPKLIATNLNLRSIELLHNDDNFDNELNANYIIYPVLYNASNKNLSLTNFKIIKHEDSKNLLFPNGIDGGISLLGSMQAIIYCSFDVLKRNTIIHDIKDPMQQTTLNEYLQNYGKYFEEAKVKPIHWERLRVPPLYYLSFRRALTFFKQNPHHVKLFATLPQSIKEALLTFKLNQ